MEDKSRIVFLENRVRAIYHNCHAQASFLRADAEDMPSEKECMLKEAQAYEVVAGWLQSIVK